MKLEIRSHQLYEDQPEGRILEYIHPLEEIRADPADHWCAGVLPSEQGELLLEFIRKHLKFR